MFGLGKPALARERREPQLAPISKDSREPRFPDALAVLGVRRLPELNRRAGFAAHRYPSATVYGCAKARSEDLAKMPLVLQRRSPGAASRWCFDHPIARPAAPAERWMTPFTFKRFVELSVCYRGNAYVVILARPGGRCRNR